MAISDFQSESPAYIRLLIICCLITFICYVAIQMRMPIVPLYARFLNIPTSHIGIINSIFFLFAGLLSIPMGLVSDHIGRKWTSSVGLILLCTASFLLCYAKSFIQFCSISFLIGIGIAAFAPTMMSFVADISPPTHLGRSYGWYTTAVFSGMSIGPALGGYIANYQSFQTVFFLSGLIILVGFTMIIILFPKPKSSKFNPKGKKTMNGLQTEILKNSQLIGCLLATLGGTFGLGMFMSFVPLHANHQGLTVKDIGIIFMIQGIFNGISRIPFGHLSDTISDRKYLVMVGLIGLAGSMAGLGISKSFTAFVIFSACFGISMGLAFTSIGAIISLSVHPSFRGIAMGSYNTCIYLGMMISSGLMGAIIQKIGFDNGFYLTGCFILSFLCGFYFLYRKAK